MKKLALLTASLALLASPVFAEEAKTTGTAPAEAKFSTVSKDEMFSSKLKGVNIYNQKNESVGVISDIAIKNNQVDALILSVGGFLGVGEHYVAVSPSSVSIRRDAKNGHSEKERYADPSHRLQELLPADGAEPIRCEISDEGEWQPPERRARQFAAHCPHVHAPK